MSRLIGRHRKASAADKAAEVKPVVEKKKLEVKEDKKVSKQPKKDK